MIVNSSDEFLSASPITKAKALSEVIRMGLTKNLRNDQVIYLTPDNLGEIADILDDLVSALERP